MSTHTTHTPRVALVHSRYNPSITDALWKSAVETYNKAFRGEDEPDLYHAPGAFEVPVLAAAAARSGKYDGVVAIACIIKGETSHDHHIATSVATALQQTATTTLTPIAFAVLTVDTPEQAAQRAGGAMGNKGEEAMLALLDTIDQLRKIQDPTHTPQPPRTHADKAVTNP